MGDALVPDQGFKTKTKPEVKEPKKYQVVLYNDDYTTMEWPSAMGIR